MDALRLRGVALATILAFLGGTTAIPVVHLLFHDRPHDHVGGEIHYHEHPHDDPHDHDPHDHDHEAEPGSDDEPLHHGDGATAHFSLAISDAVATAIVLATGTLAPALRVGRPTQQVVPGVHVAVSRFRGPPRF